MVKWLFWSWIYESKLTEIQPESGQSKKWQLKFEFASFFYISHLFRNILGFFTEYSSETDKKTT
jgi:hypothetical protein